jgi:hypothetical protein
MDSNPRSPVRTTYFRDRPRTRRRRTGPIARTDFDDRQDRFPAPSQQALAMRSTPGQRASGPRQRGAYSGSSRPVPGDGVLQVVDMCDTAIVGDRGSQISLSSLISRGLVEGGAGRRQRLNARRTPRSPPWAAGRALSHGSMLNGALTRAEPLLLVIGPNATDARVERDGPGRIEQRVRVTASGYAPSNCRM